MSNIWFGDYTVYIQENFQKMTNNVFLFKREQGVDHFVKGNGTVQAVERGEVAKLDELVFAEMSDDQLRAFASALSERGIKPDHVSVAEGKLEATQKHLEDMRLIALAPYQENKK